MKRITAVLMKIKNDKDNHLVPYVIDVFAVSKSRLFAHKATEEDLIIPFITAIKYGESKVPGFIDFLISRNYLFEKFENPDLNRSFLLLDKEIDEIYLGERKTPSVRALFSFYKAIVEEVQK